MTKEDQIIIMLLENQETLKNTVERLISIVESLTIEIISMKGVLNKNDHAK